MRLLVNIDVPDLERGVAFYEGGLGLVVTRRIGEGGVELSGLDAPVYLLASPEGTPALPDGSAPRSYLRHWTPVHLDIVVDDVVAARDRAVAAGATLERDVSEEEWGRIALLADPFGNGFCLIEFVGRGYDEIT